MFKKMILSRNIKIIIGRYIIYILLKYAWIWNDYIKIYILKKNIKIFHIEKKEKTNNKKIVI